MIRQRVNQPCGAVLAASDVAAQAEAEGLTLLEAENSTGYFGVSHYPQFSKSKPYQARVRRGGERVSLGFFATAEGGRPGGDDVRNARASRAFVVHYFLADDTVEVLEVLPRNSGMGDFPKILRRQKLPKPTEGGGYGVGIRPAGEDTMRRRERDTYSWRDLKIGEVISSYGLILTLRDCDAHTRDWYESELGMDPERDFEAIAPPPGPPPIVRQPPPPHVSGIGSERDSLESSYDDGGES